MIRFTKLLAVLDIENVGIVVNGNYIGQLSEDKVFTEIPDIYRRTVLSVTMDDVDKNGVIVYLGDVMD